MNLVCIKCGETIYHLREPYTHIGQPNQDAHTRCLSKEECNLLGVPNNRTLMTPSNELIEEAAKEYAASYRRVSDFADGYADSFYAGAKWAQEQMTKEIEKLQETKGIPKADVDELVELLESARGWVSTHAMQTYSRVASAEAEKIEQALTNYRSKHGGRDEFNFI